MHVAAAHRIEPRQETREAILTVEGLTKSFGDRAVLRGIDLSLHRSEVLAIIGPSGSGKSTLIRCMNLLETPSSGCLRVDGEAVWQSGSAPTDRDLRQLRNKVGMVFQAFNLFPTYTAIENVMLAQVYGLGRSKESARQRSEELLVRVGLADHLNHRPSALSGGQQQRVAIARALALDPQIMLFDEPTSAIDPEIRAEVLTVMRDLAQGGMTMAIVTHELGFARNVADRVIFIDGGYIVEEGLPGKLLTDPVHERTKRFISAVRGEI